MSPSDRQSIANCSLIPWSWWFIPQDRHFWKTGRRPFWDHKRSQLSPSNRQSITNGSLIPWSWWFIPLDRHFCKGRQTINSNFASRCLAFVLNSLLNESTPYSKSMIICQSKNILVFTELITTNNVHLSMCTGFMIPLITLYLNHLCGTGPWYL